MKDPTGYRDLSQRVLLSRERQLALEDLVKDLTQHAMAAGLFRSCLNCQHWRNWRARTTYFPDPGQDIPEHCSKFNTLPPARIIVSGCDEHTDSIPF